MTLFAELLGEKRALTGRDLEVLAGALDDPSLTGVRVTPEKSISHSAVAQAAQVIASTAAMLPCILYERRGEDRERATGHRLYRTLHDRPNPEVNRGPFVRAQYLSKLLWGARYAEIELSAAGEPLWLWHLPPSSVTPRRIYKRLGSGLTSNPDEATPEDRRRGGSLFYEVAGTARGSVFLPASKVFAVVDHLSWDGITPVSRIRAVLEPIALGLAAQETASALMGNNATPGGVIKRPREAPPLSPMGERALLASFEKSHRGTRKSGRLAVLQEGAEFEAITLKPADAQLLEILNLSILQVAHVFNMPPYFLGHQGASNTYSNVEAEWQKLITQTLQPHLTDDEQEIAAKLLTEAERPRFYAEHELKALLRGDSKTRAEIYKLFLESGTMTPNHVARAENLPPIPADQGGDTYRLALNFGPAGGLLDAEPAGAEHRADPALETRDGAEIRARNSAQARQRLQAAYQRLFASAAARLVRRELARLAAILARTLEKGEPPECFVAEAEELYTELAPLASRELQPIFASYAELIQAEIAKEVGGDGEISAELERFVGSYTRRAVERQHQVSIERLRELADGEDPLGAIVADLEEWPESRPQQFGARETVRSGGAFARAAYVAAGIVTMRWFAVGTSCPLCSSLHGRRVGAQQPFLATGDRVDPGEEGTAPLTASHPIFHPPLHGGCDCLVIAG